MSSLPTSSSSSDADSSQFDVIGDLRCPITILLGTATITVRECLNLERHSIIRLGQSAGEDLRIDINGVTIGRGEVAIMDTNTAIRLTELAPAPSKRG